MDSTPVLVNYQFLRSSGNFRFAADPGTCQIFAFEDTSGDLKYQYDEPGVHSPLLSLEAGVVNEPVELHLTGASSKILIDWTEQLQDKISINLPSFKKYLGQIVTLDDPAFDADNKWLGLWEPMNYIRNVPFGVFFLEKYSHEKTPVLFVHGMNGSPRHFGSIIAGLDRKKFQPWAAYYPSGLRLNSVVQLLDSVVNELHAKYKFKNLFVVAHSMGGLASRSFILRDVSNQEMSVVRLFITIGTPWGGHSSAERGVKNSPVVMPVWNDMAIGSPFLDELFLTSLPESVPYHLIFSYGGGSIFLGGKNDNVVTIDSQLRAEAQAAARTMRGFNASHVGILNDPDAISLVNAILAERVRQLQKDPF